MAGTPGAKVSGGPQLARAFDRMADRLDDFAAVHDAAADPVVASARAAVPIVSGALLDTIRSDPFDVGSYVVAGSDQVRYAGVINYGWPDRNIDPQPFLDDAIVVGQDAAAAVYADKVAELVRTFDREAP